MTSANRLNSTAADPSKAKSAERDKRDASADPALIELDMNELTMVGGGQGPGFGKV